MRVMKHAAHRLDPEKAEAFALEARREEREKKNTGNGRRIKVEYLRKRKYGMILHRRHYLGTCTRRLTQRSLHVL